MYAVTKFIFYLVQLLDILFCFLLSLDYKIYFNTHITPTSYHVSGRQFGW